MNSFLSRRASLNRLFSIANEPLFLFLLPPPDVSVFLAAYEPGKSGTIREGLLYP
jgi:hypothetical protein